METSVGRAVPVIDLSDISTANRLDIARKLVHAMETVGFLYLDGIPGYNEEELMYCVKWFFDLPIESKLAVGKKQYNSTSKQVYRGYFGLNQEDVSYKEGYEFGQDLCQEDEVVRSGLPLYEQNIWPRPSTDEEKPHTSKFRDKISLYYKTMVNTATEFMHLFAMGLNLPDTYFDSLFLPRTLSTLRLLHYPLRRLSPPLEAYTAEGDVLCCAAHCDGGFVTLLATFDEGLQVMLGDESWFDVPPRRGSVLVNLGELLCNMTGGRVKATKHRVKDIGRDRYSVPFFFEPGYHSQVPPYLPVAGSQNRSLSLVSDLPGSYQYGVWVMERNKRYVEYQDIS